MVTEAECEVIAYSAVHDTVQLAAPQASNTYCTSVLACLGLVFVTLFPGNGGV